ncbi:hypothetical protein BH10ACI1_BH10ACI1_03150 [soil metagenome]
MRGQFLIAQTLLWLFVITLGITLGGGLYETLVTMPLWSASPPDSVIDYYHHNIANPSFALNQGGRFWVYFTPLLGLLAIATFLSGFKTRPEHRRWRITGTVLALIVIGFTFVWFIPNIIKLMSEAVLRMNADELTNLTNNWVRLNWVRAFLYSAAWIAALRALSIPPKIGSRI